MPDKAGKIASEDGWVICPGCGKSKLLRLDAGGTVRKAYVYCRRCRREYKLNIDLSLSH